MENLLGITFQKKLEKDFSKEKFKEQPKITNEKPIKIIESIDIGALVSFIISFIVLLLFLSAIPIMWKNMEQRIILKKCSSF